MAKIRPLAHPPIVEAIVDFRANVAAPDFRPTTFLDLKGHLGELHYTVMEERRFFTADVQFRGGAMNLPQAQTSGIQGYLFRTEDGLNVAQFRVDGFTYNRLAPYTSFDEIRPVALQLWELFLGVAKPTKLERLALRYLNRMEVPAQSNLSQFFEVMPKYYAGSPKYLSTFATRVNSHDPETGYFANIGQALQPGVGTENITMILDIDVFRVTGLAMGREQLEPILDGLRSMKNEIFFGAITEATAERYS